MADDETPKTPPPPPPEPPAAPPAAPPPEPPANAADSPAEAAGPSDNRAIWIVLSYLGLLALIPLLVERDDQEVQWHAKHGLVLLVFEVVAFVGLGLINMVLSSIVGVFGCIGCAAVVILAIAVLVVHVMCIVKGLNGERFLVPVVSDFVEKF